MVAYASGKHQKMQAFVGYRWHSPHSFRFHHLYLRVAEGVIDKIAADIAL
jgi:hypothetical protein